MIREMAMIRSFYEGCARSRRPRLEELLKTEFDLERAKTLFERPEQARLFVKTLICSPTPTDSFSPPRRTS